MLRSPRRWPNPLPGRRRPSLPARRRRRYGQGPRPRAVTHRAHSRSRAHRCGSPRPVRREEPARSRSRSFQAAATAVILRDLGASGIRIAVDDFGTGYSSLSYLRQFELDVLKVDGSFVKGIGRTSGDETIVNTIIGMAHSLDLEVIAEGVETLEQIAFLSAKGCDVVQGFAIAPALPGTELETFVRRRDAGTGT